MSIDRLDMKNIPVTKNSLSQMQTYILDNRQNIMALFTIFIEIFQMTKFKTKKSYQLGLFQYIVHHLLLNFNSLVFYQLVPYLASDQANLMQPNLCFNFSKVLV